MFTCRQGKEAYVFRAALWKEHVAATVWEEKGKKELKELREGTRPVQSEKACGLSGDHWDLQYLIAFIGK